MAKKEFGDFQTPESLAIRSVALTAELFGTPDLVIEPTAGLGMFLKAAAMRWGCKPEYQGYEINTDYVHAARQHLSKFPVQIFHRDFFAVDWKCNLAQPGIKILVIGNPPWVTNSNLGQTWRSQSSKEDKLPRIAWSRRPHGQIKLRHL